MNTVPMTTPELRPAEDGRALALFGVIAGIGGGVLVTVFWAMAALLVFTNNGGFITELALQGVWLWAFYSYPIVLLLFSLISVGLFVARRELEAVAAAGVPIALVVLYYFALIVLR